MYFSFVLLTFLYWNEKTTFFLGVDLILFEAHSALRYSVPSFVVLCEVEAELHILASIGSSQMESAGFSINNDSEIKYEPHSFNKT